MAPIASVEELRKMLNVRAGVPGAPVDDEFLGLLLDAASEGIERYCDREFRPSPGGDPEGTTTRVVFPSGARYVQIPDVRALTSLQADGRELVGGANPPFQTFARRGHPAHALLLDAPARRLELVGRFGFAEPPPDVRLAVLAWASRTYHERSARQADQVIDPEGGVANYFRQIPQSIRATLARYRVIGL